MPCKMRRASNFLTVASLWTTAPRSRQIAGCLLATMNKTAPDAATLAATVTALNTETGVDQGNFLKHLAESTANQVQVDLIGLAATGLEFASKKREKQ